MDKKSLITTSIFCFLILFYSCKNENKQFSELIINKDLKKAYDFKTKYPESKFNIDSLIQELEYQRIQSSQSIQINFMGNFPNTLHKDSVQKRLYRLEWDNLKTIWSVDEVKKYINKYPESPYRAQADEWLFDNSSSGIFIDIRDNKQYNWTKIGDQIWMSSRLEYQKYSQKLVMNADYWWKYSYEEMSNAAPIGWHIATHEDWTKAIETILNTSWDKIPVVDKLNRIILGRCFLSEAYEKEDHDVRMLTGGTNYKNVIFWSMDFNNSGQIECLSMVDPNWLFFSFDSPNAKHTVLCVKDSKNLSKSEDSYKIKDKTLKARLLPPPGLYVFNNRRGYKTYIRVLVNDGIMTLQKGDNEYNLTDADIMFVEDTGEIESGDIGNEVKYVGNGIIEVQIHGASSVGGPPIQYIRVN